MRISINNIYRAVTMFSPLPKNLHVLPSEKLPHSKDEFRCGNCPSDKWFAYSNNFKPAGSWSLNFFFSHRI